MIGWFTISSCVSSQNEHVLIQSLVWFICIPVQSELTFSLLLLLSSRRRKRLGVRLLSFRPCPRPLLSSCISLRSRITSSWPAENGKSVWKKDEEGEDGNSIERGKALDSTLTSSSLLDTLHQINTEPEHSVPLLVFSSSLPSQSLIHVSSC